MIITPDIINKLHDSHVKRVAVQLPEGLKRNALVIAQVLRKEGFEVLISGDACWGACDLALDARNMADVLIHIGHTPVTKEENVIYIPYKQDIQINILLKSVPKLKNYSTVGIVTTIQHSHQSLEMVEWLKEHGVNAITSKGSERTPKFGQVLGCTYAAAKNVVAEAYLYVGTGVFHAVGVALATGKPTFALDPYGDGTIQAINTDRLLKQRFIQIEKAKKAKNFGILLSSKSGQARRNLAESLALQHPYAVVILIREITEMELRNLGFDAYVNTACPRLTLEDQVRFNVPILSATEFEIVLGKRNWDEYKIDEIV